MAKIVGPTSIADDQRFDEWWERDGRFIDPDTSDVPWFDKRKGLAAYAFHAAMAQSRNYVADDASEATQFTFANGRVVAVGDDGYLRINFIRENP